MAFTMLGKKRKAAAEETAKHMATEGHTLKEIVTSECKKMQEVAPDMNILCEDDQVKPDMVLPAGADCEAAQHAAEKIGISVLCDEENK